MKPIWPVSVGTMAGTNCCQSVLISCLTGYFCAIANSITSYNEYRLKVAMTIPILVVLIALIAFLIILTSITSNEL